MGSILDQLIEDFRNFLKDNDDYKDMFLNPSEAEKLPFTVKEVYDTQPKIKYPLITVEEITNEEDTNFRNNNGEQISYLVYEISIYSRQTTKYEAPKTVRKIGKLINDYLSSSLKYRCLTRIGTPALLPSSGDKSIMRYVLRYDCNLDIKGHIIYQKI